VSPTASYIYGGLVTQVLSAIYDGPIDELNYRYHPVILERLPRLDVRGSGARLDIVSVEPGERYVDPVSEEVVTATQRIGGLQRITARFTIKRKIRWQDGSTVTADDSVFSRDLACHPDTPTSKFVCRRTAHYVKVDPRTVEWQGLPGFIDPGYVTNFYAPLPRHQPGSDGTPMARMTPREILEDEAFARQPWSYGPFKILQWLPGEAMVFDRNPYYWRAGEGLPFLDAVVFRFPSDASTQLADVLAGEVDVALPGGLEIRHADYLDSAAAAGELVPYYETDGIWEHIDFNLDPLDERVPLGACRDVRRAIAHGTDRHRMTDVVMKGKTSVFNSLVPNEHWAFPPANKIVTYDYDPAKARALLEGAGFVDVDGIGLREAARDIICTITTDAKGTTKDQVVPRGTPLALTLMTTSGNRMREDVALLFQQNMKAIGVDVALEFMPANVYFADGPDGPLFGRRFDLGEYAWPTGAQPPLELYLCSSIPRRGNRGAGPNETGWCDPRYDTVATQAAATLTRREALPFYREAQRLLMEEVPILPLFAWVRVSATTPEVANYQPAGAGRLNRTSFATLETWNIEEWGFRPGAASVRRSGSNTY